MASAGLATAILSQIFPHLSNPYHMSKTPVEWSMRSHSVSSQLCAKWITSINTYSLGYFWKNYSTWSYKGIISQLFHKLRLFTPLSARCTHCIATSFCLCVYVYSVCVHMCVYSACSCVYAWGGWSSSSIALCLIFRGIELTQLSWIG